MKLVRHYLTSLASALVALSVSSAAVAANPVKLIFRQFDSIAEVGGLVAAVDKWNAANPDIQVELRTMSRDTLAQLSREIPAGAGPDIQHLAFVWTRDLGRSGLLLPLNDLIDASQPGDGIDDFLALDLATLDGTVYGLPWSADTFSLAYRPDILEEAGITTFPSSWDDLAVAAKSLTRDTDGNGRVDQYGFCFPAGSAPEAAMWYLVNYYIWSNGATFAQETSPGNWEIQASADDIAKAMTYFNGFFDEGSAPENLLTVNSWGDPEIVGGLGRGDCAITFFPPQTFRAAQAQSDVPLSTAAIPEGTDKRISHLGGRALGINPNTKHPKEAWEFVKYLASPDTFATYKQYPSQKSVLSKLDIPPAEKGFVEMLPLAITFERYISSPMRVSSMQEAVNRQFGAVYSHQRTAEEAAEALLSDLNKLLVQGAN